MRAALEELLKKYETNTVRFSAGIHRLSFVDPWIELGRSQLGVTDGLLSIVDINVFTREPARYELTWWQTRHF